MRAARKSGTKRFPILALVLLGVLLFTAVNVQGKKPVVLTDKNFEHDTQATTGGTTGDWFVSFCDREKNEKVCTDSDSVWTELSQQLTHRVSIA